ncbi:DUF5677 domain-containing protein [Nioella nitratireducens]|uniref:DUF5677 domain-containing protein n=1 Tax=Nioella nitratireducens TaxID=1287720 RepID=UPI0011BA60DC|nr:DUF5677 domain-containing protein [Nioella nitratireducens]
MTQVRELTDRPSDLKELCERIQGRLQPDISELRTYNWVGSTETKRFEFIRRAAVVRQAEACSAIHTLVSSGNGAMGVVFLRPAYEELLWIEYLQKNSEIAPKLASMLTIKELSEAHHAQRTYLGQKGIQRLGFSRKLSRRLDAMKESQDKELKEIGKTLGWRQGASQPSMAFVARQVGREKEYNYIYQGTSRAVHFSPHELQRRVWGKFGEVSISSSSFDRYWSDFSLYWSTRILFETMIFSGFTKKLEEAQPASGEDFHKELKALRPVPILTAGELEAWDEPRWNASDLWNAKP